MGYLQNNNIFSVLYEKVAGDYILNMNPKCYINGLSHCGLQTFRVSRPTTMGAAKFSRNI
jgi:hypothetical protein